MANHDLKENVLLNLRSVTQSCKGGVPFERLQRDYRDLLGQPIPFRELGYNSLEAFIKDIPHVIALKRNNEGLLMALGVADASTAHIVSLVSRQKTETKKKPFRKPPPYSGMRRPLSSRYSFREGARGTHSRYSSSDHSSRSYPRSRTPPFSSTDRVPRSYPRSRTPPFSTFDQTSRSKTPPFSSDQNARSYSRPKTPPLRSSKVKPSKPPSPPVQHSKPRIPAEQVPVRKYEIAPRFLKQIKIQKDLKTDSVSSPELISPTTPTPSTKSQPFVSLNNKEVIDPPRASFPVKSAESKHRFQYNTLESAKTAKEYVDIYAKIHGLIPEYRTVLLGQKAKSRAFSSILKLDGKKYQSYPDMKPTEELAEEEAAKEAMAAIKKQIDDSNTLPETPYSNADEIRVLLNRIEEIVCEKPSGMFANGVVHEYEEKFCEKLPSCWPELLKQSCYVEIKELKVDYGKVPDGANMIVHPIKEMSSGNQTPSSTSSKPEYADGDLDTKTLKQNLHQLNISLRKVPEFVIPNGNIWDIFITNVGGWFSARLLDYYDEFLALSEEMSQCYKSRSFPAFEVFEYQLYAACLDDNPNLWHRVLIEEIREDGQLLCYFVDEGDFSYVRLENLQEMNPNFLNLPYQAIHLCLDGFDDYEKYLKGDILESLLLGKTLIAEVKRWYSIPDFFPEIPGIHRTVYCVTLYDTSDSSGEDVNLNELLKKSAMESAVESLSCKLPKLLTSSCAYLSHVTPEGLVYIRLTSPLHCWIEQELDRLSPIFEEVSAASTKIPLQTMCAVKYESSTWHRAIISESLAASVDSDVVEVFFVDFGHADVVGRSEICELQPISELLASLPPQAICCELLYALPSPESQWTPLATAKLLELAPFDQELIIRVMSEADGKNLAKVNLHKRNEDTNIISINDSLACNPALFNEAAIPLTIKTPSTLPLRQPTSRKSSVTSSLSGVIPDVAVPAEEQMAKRLGTSLSSDKIEWLNTPDNIKSPDALEIHKPMALSLPPVPSKGAFFDVFITMAAHPRNFVVQPLDSCSELDSLMKEMSSFYSSEDNLLEMDLSMLRKNEYYAALHSDGSWYRVRVQQIFNDSEVLVTVHYVDFGDFNTVGIGKLQPLYQKFRQLPCQAINASLAGIKPSDGDWDPVHCVKFIQMVTEKSFVSVIYDKQIQYTDDIPSLFLELTLIDTSGSNDVYINELLVEKGIAKIQ